MAGGRAAPAGDARAACAPCGLRVNKDGDADPLSLSPCQIYYKVIKDIEPGEELLVHVKEGAYTLGTVPRSLDGKPPLAGAEARQLPRPPLIPYRTTGARHPGHCPDPRPNEPALSLQLPTLCPSPSPSMSPAIPTLSVRQALGRTGVQGYGAWAPCCLTCLRVEPGAGGSNCIITGSSSSLRPRYLETAATAKMALWLRHSGPPEPCATEKLQPHSRGHSDSRL